MADGIENYEARGKYVGPIPLLKGYWAELICYPQTGRCLAEFDKPESGYIGRYDFQIAHFEIEEKTDG